MGDMADFTNSDRMDEVINLHEHRDAGFPTDQDSYDNGFINELGGDLFGDNDFCIPGLGDVDMLFGSDHELEAIDRMLNGEVQEDCREEDAPAVHMTTFTALVKQAPLRKGFRWIDQHGEEHCVKSMSTQHLFFSLRMIWNHSAPIEMRIEPYKRYYIRRSPEYLAEAVKHLVTELNTRKNLTPYFKKCLAHMDKCLNNYFRTDNKLDEGPW